MRPGARTGPIDVLGAFLTVKNLENAFAMVPQRVIDILTGKVAVPISLGGGLVLARTANNTVPVLGTPKNGLHWWVQHADPAVTNPSEVSEGDVWIKIP